MAKPKDLCNWKNIYSKNNGFSRTDTEMQQSPAFHSLTANALRFLLLCEFKNFKAATQKRVMDQSKRVFKITYLEAQEFLGLSRTTINRAKEEVIQKGFLECTTQGGLKGVNGVASEYALSNKWRKWKPPIKRQNDMKKVRAAKRNKQTPSKGAFTGSSKEAFTGCHLKTV